MGADLPDEFFGKVQVSVIRGQRFWHDLLAAYSDTAENQFGSEHWGDKTLEITHLRSLNGLKKHHTFFSVTRRAKCSKERS
jgi:hypothetical protein